MTVLEAYDLARFSEHMQERLGKAQEDLAARDGLEREKEWMIAAVDLLEAENDPAIPLLEKARSLPELSFAVKDTAAELQGQWVDVLEKLLAGITFHAGSRSPVVEALFPHLKLAALRRAEPETASAYATELDRRMKGSYITRMLLDDDFAFARPVLALIVSARDRWQGYVSAPPLSDQDATALRADLLALGERLELILRQARLLAEAALLPLPGVFETVGLNAKPKKRPARPAPAPAEEAKAEEPPAEEPPAEKEKPAPKEKKKAAPKKGASKKAAPKQA